MTDGLTASDVALLQGNTGRNDLFGGDGAWWIIILFLFAFAGGWSNNGFGGGGVGAADNYVLASDFAQVESKIDSVNNGLCNGFYREAENTYNVQAALATQGYETRNAITQAQIAQMQSANALTAQIADCCCQNREAIAGVNYNIANGLCQTNFNMQTNTRDIIEGQNANTRAILDALTQNRIEAKDAKIAEQNQQIWALQLAASQAMQNNTIINAVRPTPTPSFNVPNPYAGCGCC